MHWFTLWSGLGTHKLCLKLSCNMCSSHALSAMQLLAVLLSGTKLKLELTTSQRCRVQIWDPQHHFQVLQRLLWSQYLLLNSHSFLRCLILLPQVKTKLVPMDMHTGNTEIIWESLKSESIRNESSVAVKSKLNPMVILCLSFTDWLLQAHSEFWVMVPWKKCTTSSFGSEQRPKCNITSLTIAGSEYSGRE